MACVQCIRPRGQEVRLPDRRPAVGPPARLDIATMMDGILVWHARYLGQCDPLLTGGLPTATRPGSKSYTIMSVRYKAAVASDEPTND